MDKLEKEVTYTCRPYHILTCFKNEVSNIDLLTDFKAGLTNPNYSIDSLSSVTAMIRCLNSIAGSKNILKTSIIVLSDYLSLASTGE